MFKNVVLVLAGGMVMSQLMSSAPYPKKDLDHIILETDNKGFARIDYNRKKYELPEIKYNIVHDTSDVMVLSTLYYIEFHTKGKKKIKVDFINNN